MRVYLCGRYSRRLELAGYAHQLRLLGHDITARWLWLADEDKENDPSQWADIAQDDLEDIQASDVLIAFTETGLHPRGSRHVEFGFAVGCGLQVVVIGPCENVFHALPRVIRYETWEDFLRIWIPAIAAKEGSEVTDDHFTNQALPPM